MFVDWFTFIAQIVNFLILIWLLKRFLYGPILEAIDEREKKISGRFEEANARTDEAIREREEFRRKNDEFELGRAAMTAESEAAIKDKRQKMLDEARGEADALRERLRGTLEKERRELEREIALKVKTEVFATVRRTLSDLADVGLEEHICDIFIKRLRELGDSDKKRVSDAMKSPADVVIVRSAFELSEARRAVIEKTFAGIFNISVKFKYEVISELVCGIELTAGGYRLAWSVADYLDTLEKNMSEFFLEKIKPEMDGDGR